MELHLPLMSSSKLRFRAPTLCQRRSSSPLLFPHSTASSLCLSKAKFHYSTNLILSTSSPNYSPILYQSSSVINGSSSRSLLVRSRDGDQAATDTSNDEPTSFKRMVEFVYATWRFLRPYALYLPITVAFSFSARAFLQKPHGQPLGLSILQGLSALFVIVCLQGFTAGINEIYDLDIDKINKPHLPISAGVFSLKTAWTLVLSMAATGFAITIANGARPLTISLYCMYLIFGVLYSVPPFRFKRFTFGAYLTMAAQGAIINLGLHNTVKDTVKFPFHWNFHMTFITTFTVLMCFVYGLTKDLSDIEGDRKHNIMTPAVVHGPRKTTFLGVGVLLSVYAAIVAMAVLMPHAFRGALVIPAHGLFSMFLIFQMRVLEKANYTKEACLKFYMALWYLHYAEYIIFPFI